MASPAESRPWSGGGPPDIGGRREQMTPSAIGDRDPDCLARELYGLARHPIETGGYHEPLLDLSKEVAAGFEEAVARVTAVLKAHGFGVLTEIDVGSTLKQKLGVSFPRYVILGACNPPLAHQALQLEPMVGLMLPGNVIVREREEGGVQVAAMDPVAALKAFPGEGLREIAEEVRSRLRRIVEEV